MTNIITNMMKTFIIQSEKLFEGRLIATQPRKDLKILNVKGVLMNPKLEAS